MNSVRYGSFAAVIVCFTIVEGDLEKLDNNRIKREIFKLAPDHRVTTTADRINEPIHRYEEAGGLLSEYPVPPSEEWDALDAMDRQALTLAERHIWKLVDDKYNSVLQRWTREELEGGACPCEGGRRDVRHERA